MKKVFASPFLAPIFIIVFLITYYVLVFTSRQIGIFTPTIFFLYEILTYVFYGIAFATMAICARDHLGTPRKTTFWAAGFLMLIALLREMGAQHWLTQTDTTAIKIRFFTNPNNPMSEKIITAGILVVVAMAALWMIFKHTPKIIRGFFKMDAFYWTICTLGGTGIVSKLADRIPSRYAKITGIRPSETTLAYVSVLEEGTEATLPLLVVLAFIQFRMLMKNTTALKGNEHL